MFNELEKILSLAGADYADIRYEEMSEAAISYSGKELTGVAANDTDGYVVRVLHRGGMASVAFTRAEEAENAVRTAVENAVLFSKNSKRPVKLAEAEQVTGSFHPSLAEDPAKVGMREKIELLKKYNDIPLSSPKVVNTNMGYSEVRRTKYFANTEGSRIQETLVTTGIRGLITAKDGNLTQNIRVAAGGSDGFGTVRGQEKLFEDQTRLAVDLLSAQPVSSGVYRCLINPDLAGVFAHEAFGHFSEADIVETLPAMRQKMRLGERLGAENLSITDDATTPGQLGFYQYDDEGVAVRPVQLIREGILTGRLHSRRTAAEFGEPLTGHCVAEDYRYAPIVRMGTIFIQPGQAGLEELLQNVGNGLYLLDAKGGQTAGENFTFGANYGYLVKGGKAGPMIRDINISGNLYRTLMDIRAVGNDLDLCRTGGCGKGQTNIRSCHGGPHVVIDNLVVGGI
jgi:TldD protein